VGWVVVRPPLGHACLRVAGQKPGDGERGQLVGTRDYDHGEPPPMDGRSLHRPCAPLSSLYVHQVHHFSGFPARLCGHALQWGDVATWATAVVALAAAVAIFNLERNRDKAEKRADERAQAEQVSIYWEQEMDPQISYLDPEPRYRRRLVVHNVSDQPIYEVIPHVLTLATFPTFADPDRPLKSRFLPKIDIVGPQTTDPVPNVYASESPVRR